MSNMSRKIQTTEDLVLPNADREHVPPKPKSPNAPVEECELENVELRHAQSPETFWIIPREARESIPRGDFAKVILEDERFWVEVILRHPDGGYTGTVANDLVGIDLPHGALVQFGPEHVADIKRSATIEVPEYWESHETIEGSGTEVIEDPDLPESILLDVVAILSRGGPKRGIVVRLQLDPEEAEELASNLMEAAGNISTRGGA